MNLKDRDATIRLFHDRVSAAAKQALEDTYDQVFQQEESMFVLSHEAIEAGVVPGPGMVAPDPLTDLEKKTVDLLTAMIEEARPRFQASQSDGELDVHGQPNKAFCWFGKSHEIAGAVRAVEDFVSGRWNVRQGPTASILNGEITIWFRGTRADAGPDLMGLEEWKSPRVR